MSKEYHLTPSFGETLNRFTHFIQLASAKMHDGNCQVVSADSGLVLQYVTTRANLCQILSGCN